MASKFQDQRFQRCIDFVSPRTGCSIWFRSRRFPTPADSNGRGSATTPLFDFDFYVVNSSTFLLFVTDTQIGTGIFELQNAGNSPGALPGISRLRPAFHAHAARQ